MLSIDCIKELLVMQVLDQLGQLRFAVSYVLLFDLHKAPEGLSFGFVCSAGREQPFSLPLCLKRDDRTLGQETHAD